LRDLARKALFSLAATALLVVLIEGLSRLVLPTALPSPLIMENKDDWSEMRRYDPLLFWSLPPGVTAGLVTTNSLGLRGPEVPPKEKSELRILSLGESTTFAGRLPYEECYSHLLEADLDSALARPVRVINAGVPSYTIFQGYLYFEQRGLLLEPDVVVLYFGYNDFLPVANRARRDARATGTTAGLTDRALHERRQGRLFKTSEWIAQRSNAYRLVMRLMRPRKADVVKDPSKPRVPEEDRRHILALFRDACARNDILLVIVVPWYHTFDSHAALLREFARENGIACLDPRAEFERLNDNKNKYFLDPIHPNARGHRFIASILSREIPGLLAAKGFSHSDR
jgi:lysophospholipase L1-like esterase